MSSLAEESPLPDSKTSLPQEAKPPQCGIVMPISALDGCGESHWADVLAILSSAILESGFEPSLVSNADEVGIIQKRIIQNLYDNPVVVVDVSGKNANVMFELGMRLAFDKPTIIVKDDKTSYSFDTAPIEHVEYPRDLRFQRIVDFSAKLKDKIVATHSRATREPGYTTFLKNFGEFKVAKLDEKEVSGQELILDELRSMRGAIRRLEAQSTRRLRWPSAELGHIELCARQLTAENIDRIASRLALHPAVISQEVESLESGHYHWVVKGNKDLLLRDLQTLHPELRVIERGMTPGTDGH